MVLTAWKERGGGEERERDGERGEERERRGWRRRETGSGGGGWRGLHLLSLTGDWFVRAGKEANNRPRAAFVAPQS